MRTWIVLTRILLVVALSVGIFTVACGGGNDKSEVEEAVEEVEKALEDLQERLDIEDIDPKEALAELEEMAEDLWKRLDISDDEVKEAWEDLNQSLTEFSAWLNEVWADAMKPVPTRQPTKDTSSCGRGESAEFKVSNLNVTVEEGFWGSDFEVTVDIRNVGDCPGAHTLVSKIDGSYAESYYVTLNPGESKQSLRLIWTETQLSLTALGDTLLNPDKEHEVCVDGLCEKVRLSP